MNPTVISVLLLILATNPSSKGFTFEMVREDSSTAPVSMKSVPGSTTVDCSVQCAQTPGCLGFSWLQGLCRLFNLSAFEGSWQSSASCEVFKQSDEIAVLNESPAANLSTKLNITGCNNSVTYRQYVCTKAIDGNREQNIAVLCSATQLATNQWWEAKLSAPSFISFVTIYNIQGCCHGWLNTFNLLVDGVECNRVNLTEPFSVGNFSCNAFGSKVRVQNPTNRHLVLCEVEIYGF